MTNAIIATVFLFCTIIFVFAFLANIEKIGESKLRLSAWIVGFLALVSVFCGIVRK